MELTTVFLRVGDLKQLVDDMEAGRVETLVILGGNPAFTAPADVPFASALIAATSVSIRSR